MMRKSAASRFILFFLIVATSKAQQDGIPHDPDLSKIDFSSFDQRFLTKLIETFGPGFPQDLQSFPPPGRSPRGVPKEHTRIYNYDVGHSGHFTVPRSGGATLHKSVVFSKRRPLSYIDRKLSYGAGFPSEVVVFSPGLNTHHQVILEGHRGTAPMRLVHYSRVLGVGISEVVIGTKIDQGDKNITVPNELVPILIGQGVLDPSRVVLVSQNETLFNIKTNETDWIETMLSSSNLVDTPVKATIQDLLDVATKEVSKKEIRRNQPHLVLIMYSRATIEVSGALQLWKERAVNKTGSLELVESRLRDAVTVVTIGTGSSFFPDGPAYLHVSMSQDRITQTFGAHSSNSNFGGRDAVYLQGNSPYFNDKNEAHNFGAVIVQFLSVVLRLNNIQSFRELYEKGRVGALHQPSNMDDLVSAMIIATNGLDWVWHKESTRQGLDLPDKDDARTILNSQFGEGTYEEISQVNEGGLQGIADQSFF